MLAGVIELARANKKALIFIAKFIGLYIALNFFYGFFIEFYYPGPDPVTRLIATHTASFISLFDSGITTTSSGLVAYVSILKEGQPMLHVFEGCNAINVMIIFGVFIVAFTTQFRSAVKFIFLGLAALYIINVLRLVFLFLVSLRYPESLYFFHKFFFTGAIYAVVLFLWFLWIKKETRLAKK
jgi:exosortase family protein XrtF